MKHTILILVTTLFLCACSSGGIKEPLPLDEKGREDFLIFHQKFFSDSLFQLKRIEFPMLGSNPNGSAERFYWDVDNWKYIKAPEPNDSDIETVPFYDMEDVMRERIIIQNRFMIENLFSLIDNKWYMTQYSGIKDIGFFTGKKSNTTTTTDSTTTDSIQVSVTN